MAICIQPIVNAHSIFIRRVYLCTCQIALFFARHEHGLKLVSIVNERRLKWFVAIMVSSNPAPLMLSLILVTCAQIITAMAIWGQSSVFGLLSTITDSVSGRRELK